MKKPLLLHLLLLALLTNSEGCLTASQENERKESHPEEQKEVFYQEASWSPDGKTLLLSRYETDRYRIYRIQADGSGMMPVSEGPDYWTSWSPDGSRFVFHSGRDGNGEIYVAGIDAAPAEDISNHPAKETTPAWSPDGSKIAFISDRDGHYQLYLMNPDGSEQVRLSENPALEYNPVWSPDGQRLMFYATEDEADWVYLIDPDGSNRKRVAGRFSTLGAGRQIHPLRSRR